MVEPTTPVTASEVRQLIAAEIAESTKVSISVPAAAKRIGISDRKLWALINQGRFPPAFRIDDRVLVSVAALEEWARTQTSGDAA